MWLELSTCDGICNEVHLRRATELKRVFLFVVVALATCAGAEAQVTYQTDVPDPNGGLLVNYGIDLDFNESRVIRWSPGETQRSALSQNFKVSSNITMDKYAVQLRADSTVASDVVQLPSGDAQISVSLWELPNLSNSVYGYPAASASVGGVPKAAWTLTVGADVNSNPPPPGAAPGDWLIFDTPNIALTAGVQYGIQLAWPTVTQEVGQKIWIWVSNPDVFPDGFPVEQMANAIEGDPTINASYIKTYRSENFAIIAASALTPGDYNGNGKVDAADYALWRKSPSDYGGNPAGYNTWRSNFGNPPGSGSGSSLTNVPEPETILLVAVAIGLVSCCRERHSGSRVG
jgi:hypothetical protein